MLDFLSDILSRLSLKGTLYFRTSFVEPFGVKVPAFENVALPLQIKGGGKPAEIAEHVEELLSWVGLEDRMHARRIKPSTLVTFLSTILRHPI